MDLSLTKHAALSLDSVDVVSAVFHDPQQVRESRRRVLKIAVGVLACLFAGLFFISMAIDWHFDVVWRYEAVAVMGASVGTAELLTRYRDAPSYVLLSPPGLFYVLINAAAAVGALGLILTFGWTFGAEGGGADATQVLVAGFGAMALFRSSLLTVKVDKSDVGIGPSSVLSIIMAASDRSADRLRAADRAGRVSEIMQGVSYKAAHESLPTVAVNLMQNLSPAEEVGLQADLDALKSHDHLPDETKCLLLGLKLTNVVSTEVLLAAKKSLGTSILIGTAPERVEGAEATAAETPLARSVTAPDQGPASEDLPQTPSTPAPPGPLGPAGAT
jgi:hypothetical protein